MFKCDSSFVTAIKWFDLVWAEILKAHSLVFFFSGTPEDWIHSFISCLVVFYGGANKKELPVPIVFF